MRNAARFSPALYGMGAMVWAGCPDNGGPVIPDLGSGSSCQLKACDLVISEIHAAPASSKTDSEWFEIYNNSGAKISSLAGVIVEVWTDTLPGGDAGPSRTYKFPAGSRGLEDRGYLVVHDGTTKFPDGGAASKWYAWTGLSLRNSDATLVLKCGSTTLFKVSYGTSGVEAGTMKQPYSAQLDKGLLGGSGLNCSEAKKSTRWCHGTTKYDGANYGTPGAISDCGGSGGDGGPYDGYKGGEQSGCSLNSGDVLVTEVLPDPSSSDPKDEWLEIYNNTSSPIPGACLKVVVNNNYTCSPSGSLAAWGFVALSNGGAGAPAGTKCSNFSLSNDGATVEVYSGSTLLHKVRYEKKQDMGVAGVLPAPAKGSSVQLDSALFNSKPMSAGASQVASNWCFASGGTPGAANKPCGAKLDGGGPKDGPVASGLQPGDLLITEVQPAPKDSYMNEWLELYNNSGADIQSLSGVTVYMKSATCALSGKLGKGQYLLLHRGQTGSPTATNQLTCSTLALANDGSNLEVKDAKGGSIYKLSYGKAPDAGASFITALPASGAVVQLDSKLLTAGKVQPAATHVTSAWCDSKSTWGSGGNKGTPGAANNTCP